MKSQDGGLFDGLLGTDNKDPEPSTWEEGFQGDIHALITVADDDEDVVERAANAVRASLAGAGEVLTIENGMALRRRNAANRREVVEHFGYFDGISNPLFTKDDLQGERPENRNRDRWDAGAPLSLALTDDPFTTEPDAFGSYLVYRKLGQDVGVFNDRVMALAAALGTNPNLAGAMVVGRFKDGTPVIASDTANPGLGVLNDFDYEADRKGSRCPAQAHIRKTNPRGTQPIFDLESERTRRIVRRAIPYGKPMPDVAEGVPEDPNPSAPRGLLFMCFQQDIKHQFEFIQRTWVDNEHFPAGLIPFVPNTGDDPLIGQDTNEEQQWPKEWGDEGTDQIAFNFEAAVTLKGGEYFFAPSIPFLKSL